MTANSGARSSADHHDGSDVAVEEETEEEGKGEGQQQEPRVVPTDKEENATSGFDHDDDNDDDDDDRKVFVSRVPPVFDEERLRIVLERAFSPPSNVIRVAMLYHRNVEEDDNNHDDNGGGREEGATNNVSGGTGRQVNTTRRTSDQEQQQQQQVEAREHRGCAFVTFATREVREEALKAGVVKGKVADGKKRKYTLQIRPVVRKDDDEITRKDAAAGEEEMEESGKKQTTVDGECYLWSRTGKCRYGEECKFYHDPSTAASVVNTEATDAGTTTKKVRKCFSFRKKGKCKAGSDCPYSHDVVPKMKKTPNAAATNAGVPAGDDDDGGGAKKASNKDGEEKDDEDKREEEQHGPISTATTSNEQKKKKDSDKDCLKWKTHGKCRKGDKCPYRHDEAVQARALAKKDEKRKKRNKKASDDASLADGGKEQQPLSVRVFGMNYDTTESDIRTYFEHCGTIVEITFPTFEDSGRSRGYCGILFQSPKAVDKAVTTLDGQELHGRWLSVQAGKMFLKQWEGHHTAARAQRREQQHGLETGDDGWVGGDGRTDEKKKEVPHQPPLLDELGRKVKRRKKHGYDDVPS